MRRRAAGAEQGDLFAAARHPFASGLPFDAPHRVPRGTIPANYDAYLRTERWAELRAAALARDGHRCRFCDGDRNLVVHHRRYPVVWGTETVDDLTTMCGGCNVVFLWFRSIEQDRWARLNPVMRD